MGFFKKRAIRKYIKTLRSELPKRYGKSKHYTEGQIRRTVSDLNLNNKYIYYALAMYMTEKLYSQFPDISSLSGMSDYITMRNEIISDVFNSKLDLDSEGSIDFISDFNFMDLASNHFTSDFVIASDYDSMSYSDFGGTGGDFGGGDFSAGGDV